MLTLFANKDRCDKSLVSDFIGDDGWIPFLTDLTANTQKFSVPLIKELIDPGKYLELEEEFFGELIAQGATGVFVRAVNQNGFNVDAFAKAATAEESRILAEEQAANWTSAVEGENQSIYAGYAQTLIPYTAEDGTLYHLDVVLIPLKPGSTARCTTGGAGANPDSSTTTFLHGTAVHEVTYVGHVNGGAAHEIERRTIVEVISDTAANGYSIHNYNGADGVSNRHQFSFIGIVACEKDLMLTNIPVWDPQGTSRLQMTQYLTESGRAVDTVPVTPMIQTVLQHRFSASAFTEACIDAWRGEMDALGTHGALATTIHSHDQRADDVRSFVQSLMTPGAGVEPGPLTEESLSMSLLGFIGRDRSSTDSASGGQLPIAKSREVQAHPNVLSLATATAWETIPIASPISDTPTVNGLVTYSLFVPGCGGCADVALATGVQYSPGISLWDADNVRVPSEYVGLFNTDQVIAPSTGTMPAVPSLAQIIELSAVQAVDGEEQSLADAAYANTTNLQEALKFTNWKETTGIGPNPKTVVRYGKAIYGSF